MLTCYVYRQYGAQDILLISWDLQTGGFVSVIGRPKSLGKGLMGKPTVAYSMDGQMVGAFHWYHNASMICIYDIISGVHTHSHWLGSPFSNGGPISDDIWTHGESIRFVTAGPATMTIWEAGFASGAAPTEVETMSSPEDVRSVVPSDNAVGGLTGRVRFLPTSRRLAIAHNNKVLVWDTRNSMLSCTDTDRRPMMTFSSDGHFFEYRTAGPEIHLWKESYTGYRLCGKFTPAPNIPRRSSPLMDTRLSALVTARSGYGIQKASPPPLSIFLPQLPNTL